MITYVSNKEHIKLYTKTDSSSSSQIGSQDTHNGRISSIFIKELLHIRNLPTADIAFSVALILSSERESGAVIILTSSGMLSKKEIN